MLMLGLSLGAGLLPSGGFVPIAESLVENLLHLVLSALTLALSRAAVLGRLSRAAVLDVAQRSFVQFARAKGLAEHAVLFRHVLPNAAIPIVTVLAPSLPLGSPTDISKDLALRGPTAAEPFGRDDLGRSLLSRVIHAYRISLGVAVTSALLAVLIGGPLGLVAGYAEGLPDQLIMRPLDVLMAFPAVLLAIALMSVFGTGAVLLASALAVVYTPVMARVVRAAVLATKVEV